MPLDILLLRDEKTLATLRKSQEARFAKPELLDECVELDNQWRKAEFELNNARKGLNALSKKYGELRKNKAPESELNALKEDIEKCKENIKTCEERESSLAKELESKFRRVGNLVHESVPIDNNEDNNLVVCTWGECKPTTKYHHHELLYMIDGYSPSQGARVAGHRGYYLKGVGVLLNQALINYGISYLMKHQYTPVQPPFFMKKDIMAGTAQLEEFDESLYKVSGGDAEDMYLIATSEQPISAYHMNEFIETDKVPIRYAGVSTCFRKEAGSYGRDAWGIFRIHQFEKVEQFVISSPEKSVEMHEEMCNIAQEFYKTLGLSYRVVSIVSGALNNAAAKKLDLEAWFPTLGLYRELVSGSNCTDYQARSMETRYGYAASTDKEKKYVHMLNATLCATERTICCILENYQTEDGVIVPEVLRPYMGGLEFMKFVNPCPKNPTLEKQKAAKKNDEKKAE